MSATTTAEPENDFSLLDYWNFWLVVAIKDIC